jgi:hypothetical protein
MGRGGSQRRIEQQSRKNRKEASEKILRVTKLCKLIGDLDLLHTPLLTKIQPLNLRTHGSG